MTRAEHLAWAKARALELLPANPNDALASITSDLQKHPELKDHLAIEFGGMLLFSGQLESATKMREWIEGIN